MIGAAFLLAAAATSLAVSPASAARTTTCTVNGVEVTASAIDGTDGTDTIVCKDGVSRKTSVNGMGADDTVTITGSVEGVVDLGDGNDTVEVLVPETRGAGIEQTIGTAAIYGGAGDDTIFVRGGDGVLGAAGDGNSDGGIIDGGDGNDQIIVGGGSTIGASGGAGNRGTITGGTGNDEITVIAGIGHPTGEGQSSTGTLDGGADTDTCQVSGTNAGAVTNCEP